jgi:hypothetical protein
MIVEKDDLISSRRNHDLAFDSIGCLEGCEVERNRAC